MSVDYTVVLGVDKNHLQNLKVVLPNWRQYRPEFFERPFVIFFDRESTIEEEVRAVFDAEEKHPCLSIVSWPPPGVTYPVGTCKWDNQQRHKMLAGFVHVPPTVVRSPYWLKVDLDAICTQTGAWVQTSWFEGDPAIVAPAWGYTKPIDQMDKLDEWANQLILPTGALRLPRNGQETMLRHHRICSWLAFFSTDFTEVCSGYAEATCGVGQIPAPSQDGYHWYMATRLQLLVNRVDMKATGWDVKANLSKVEKAIACLREGSST